MKHFPVTPRCWRGIWNLTRKDKYEVAAACSWKKDSALERYSFHFPTCPDCIAYKTALERMGR